MLKIKDNVDLKELEKFGFEKSIFVGEHYEKEVNNIGTYWINEKSKIIYFEANEIEDIALDDTLYDLIQAGLVEKEE